MSKLITLDYQGLAVTASVLRFNAVQPVLIPTQGQTPETPLKRKFTALLNVLAESFRIDVNLMLLAAKCRLKQNLQHRVDSHSKPRQYALACFNKPPSREKLAQNGRQAAFNSLLSGNFYSVCISPSFTFHGRQGQGSAMPSWFVLPVSHPLPFVCRPPCENGKRQRSQNER